MNTLQSQASTNKEFSELQKIIMKIIGQEFIEEKDIRPDSIVSEDLKLDQFDVHQLREEILNRFGRHCDLFMYIYQLDMDQLINLTVGHIAGFVKSCS